jgi:hypothetical protein
VKSLFLVRGKGIGDKLIARALGTKLMQQGHTVFLSDNEEDIEMFGDVVDGYVEITPHDGLTKAVLYDLPERATPSRAHLRERAVLSLPSDDLSLSSFAENLNANGSAQ